MTRRLSVLSRVSSVALAVAMIAGPSPAAAQSLLGTPTVTHGSVNITEGPTTTDLDVSSSTAVIDWTPDDNAVGNFGVIAFQNSGTTATFSSGSDFAILNRVNVADSSRGIFMNGTINSLVNSSAGGSVYFYSPSGFVIGANAVINVGSLVLSASPIAVDGNGNFISGTTVTFNQAVNPDALINTVAGSQISANGTGNYVALVAPQVSHHGTIRTDTAAALVAAEAATINFSPDGLFNIQVTVGTDDANGINVDGGTIARNSATEGIGNHYAYLVAVAKNDAVTMLVNNGGLVGFDTATSAAVENNVVVLSGGYDVFAGQTWTSSGVSTVDLQVNNAAFLTDTIAHVSGAATINSANGTTSFGGNLSLTSGGNALIDALNGNALSIAGNLDVAAFASNPGGGRTGQQVLLRAQGSSTLSIDGDVYLDADSFGADAAYDDLDGANATGGTVTVQATNSGTLNIAGSLDMTADGFGGDNFYSNGAGGNGTGGLAHMQASGGGTINVDGAAFASAEGFGGSSGECSACLITGGIGTGGQVNVEAGQLAGNAINFGSDVTLTAAGFGGAGDVASGSGLGGSATLFASDGATISVAADTLVDASGFGGYGFDTANGGLGRGGSARIGTGGTAGSTIDLTGPVFVSANGEGGAGLNGGTGTGGIAYIGAVLGTVHAFNDVVVSANSNGGFVNSESGTGGAGLADIETTLTPEMTEAALFASGGTLIVDGLTIVAANATGGDGGFNGGDGGDAVAAGVAGVIGGGALIHAANSDDGPSVIQLGDVVVMAEAQGGQGSDGQGGTNGSDGGNGGSATGGKAVVTAAAGSGDLTAAATILSASATGGDGGSGGSSDGGNGGNGGNGGTATGGFINVGTESGNVNFAQGANNGTASYATIVALATATGGAGGDGTLGTISGIGGNGGDAFGGNSVLLVRGSEVIVGNVLLDASATGGNGGLSPDDPNGNGGDATTGAVGVLVTNRFNLPLQRGTLYAGDISGTAIAIGGAGGTGNGLSLSTGGNVFGVVNSDATLSSVALVTQADAYDSGSVNASPSYIEIRNGAVDVGGQFVFQTPGPVAMWADGATLDAAQIFVGADNFIHDDTVPAPVSPGTFSADDIFLTTGQDLIVDGHLVSTNALFLGAPGLIDVEDVTSSDIIVIDAGTSMAFGDLDAASGINLEAGTSISGGNVITGAGFEADALGGSMTLGNVDAVSFLVMHAAGDVTTGDLDSGAGYVWADAQAGSTSVGNVSGGSVDLTATGSVTAGDVQSSIDWVFARADGGLLTIGNVDAATFARLLSPGGAISAGDISALTTVELDANGDIGFGDVTADDFDFDSGGAVTGGNIIAGTNASGSADGAVSLVDISVGILLPGGPTDDGFAVGLSSATSITVGNVEADEGIGFATLGSLTTGTLNAGTDVLAMVGGDMSFGAITTGTTGRTYLADVSMFLDAGGPDDFDPSLVFGATPVRSGGTITINGPVSTGQFQAAGAAINAGNITAPIGIYLDSAGGISTGDLLTANGDVIAQSDGNMALADVTAGSDVQLDSGAGMTIGNVIAQTGSVQASAVDVLSFLSISAGTFVTIDPTDIIGGDITALAGDVTATGDTIDIGNVSASDNVFLTALTGDLSTLAINAGLDVTLDATGDVTTGNITAGGLIDATGASLILGNLNSNSIDLTTTVADLTVGNVTIPGNLALTTAGDLIFGDLSAFDVDLAATGSMTGGDIDSATDITALAGTNMSLGDLVAGGNVSATGGSLDLGNVSGSVLDLTSTLGDVSTVDLVAFGSLNIDSAEDFLFGSILAPLVDLAVPGSIIGGFIDSDTDITAVAGIDIDVGDLTAGGFDGEVVQLGDISLTAGGDISTGLVSAEGAVSGNAAGSISTLDIDALDFVQLFAGGGIATGNILAGDFIDIFSTAGSIATGDLTGTDIDLEAGGDISFANVDADNLDFDAGGDVDGGNIVVTTRAGGDAEGAVTLGNITAGPNIPLADDFSVGIASATSINVGNVSGAGHVGFATFGDLVTGNLTGGDLVMTLVGGDISTGSITTAANGRVYMADASMFATGGGGDEGEFDQNIVLALDPVPTGGSINIDGPVSTGRFQAAAGDDLTTQAITANSIEASAGGLATINGMWSAPNVELWSNDIDIAAGAGIDAGNSGLIRLVSTNATQALIGDGLTGTGYRLTNAEFGRLSAGNVEIGARGDASAAIDMLIGDLSITGPQAGSTIDDPNGSVVFATGNPQTQVAGGVIRITGNVNATGFTDTNALEFYTGRFELDAATGSINILGSGTDLSGELYIEADRIHVASGTILDQLAADPHYAGYVDDINAPAAVQRPEGVVRAGSIDVLPSEAILVQNTGTEDTPAGFLTFADGPFEFAGETSGPIEVIINGHIITEGGTLTGVAVRDFLADGANLSLFADNSMINGCLLAGDCGGGPIFPPEFTPTPGIQDEITLFEDNLLPPPDFGNEDFIDDNDEETDEGETSPIVPPDPLFDTSELGEADGAVSREVGTPMRSSPGLTETGDVDDPVSGGGNPSLMETPPGSPPVEEEKP